MNHSHPFHTMSIRPPLPEIGLFQTFTLNFKVKVMGVIKRQGHVVSPVSDSLPFYFTSIRTTLPKIQQFWNLTLKKSKVKVMGEAKGQGRIFHPVFKPIHFLSISWNWPTIPVIWRIECLTKTAKKNLPKIFIVQTNKFFLNQCHSRHLKVIQYIFPDPCFSVPNM